MEPGVSHIWRPGDDLQEVELTLTKDGKTAGTVKCTLRIVPRPGGLPATNMDYDPTRWS